MRRLDCLANHPYNQESDEDAHDSDFGFRRKAGIQVQRIESEREEDNQENYQQWKAIVPGKPFAMEVPQESCESDNESEKQEREQQGKHYEGQE